jgi:hypothetical protein
MPGNEDKIIQCIDVMIIPSHIPYVTEYTIKNLKLATMGNKQSAIPNNTAPI